MLICSGLEMVNTAPLAVVKGKTAHVPPPLVFPSRVIPLLPLKKAGTRLPQEKEVEEIRQYFAQRAAIVSGSELSICTLYEQEYNCWWMLPGYPCPDEPGGNSISSSVSRKENSNENQAMASNTLINGPFGPVIGDSDRNHCKSRNKQGNSGSSNGGVYAQGADSETNQ